MKKIKYLLFTTLVLFVGLLSVNAASVNLRVSTSSVTIGNSVSVTVGVSGADGWEYCVNYNQELFKLIEAGSDTGGACVKTGGTSTGYSSVTYRFQALKSGSASFSASGNFYNYSDSAENGIASSPLSGSSAAVTVRGAEEASKQITNNANLSSNANLRVFEVVGYQIEPEFNKNITEYTLNVDSSVESVQVNAYREDNTARTTPIDIVNLTEGVNKVSVTITAAKGNKKTYTILITRAEVNPVKVTIDGKEYSVVNKENAIELPAGYVTTSVNIDGKEVMAYKNNQANITLVILKDADTNMAYYIYKDGEFSLYKQITSNAITLVPVSTKETIKGYENTKSVNIGDKDITVYYKNDSDNIVLVYGVNTITGDESWYYYDINDGTMLKYTDTSTTVEETKITATSDKDYKFLALLFVCASALALLLIIILVLYIARLKRKNDELYNYMENRMKKHRDKKFNNIGDKDIEKSDLATFEDDTRLVEKVEEEPEIKEEKEVEKPKKEDKEEVTEEIEEIVDDVLDLDEVEDFDDKTIVLREEDILDLDDDFEEKPKKKKENKKVKEPTFVSDTDILNNIAKANAESFEDDKPKKLTRKEEKLQKKREKALTKKAQREFLNDETFEESAFDIYEREETEVIPVVNKKPRKKGRKKS